MRLKQVRLIRGQSQFDVFSNWQLALACSLMRRGGDARLMSVSEDAACPGDSGAVSVGFNLVRNWGAPSLDDRRYIVWSVDHPAFNNLMFLRRIQNSGLAAATEMMSVGRARARARYSLASVSTPSLCLQEPFGEDGDLMVVPAGREEYISAQLDAAVTADRRPAIQKRTADCAGGHTMDIRAGQILKFIEISWGLTADEKPEKGLIACAE